MTAGTEPGAELPGRTLVVGTGLVGTSIGLALTRAGGDVWLRDANPTHAAVAAGLGAGRVADEALTPESVDLVVVAVSPGGLARVVAESLAEFSRAVVTDVGSVKGSVLRELATGDFGLSPKRDGARYVGSHPMAGSHFSGPLTARADLFEDRAWVVCPHPGAGEPSLARVRALVAACGAVGIEVDVDAHDRAVARVSHLPQLVSSLTAAQLVDAPEQELRLAGQGLRDVTRIAGSDTQLWRQIVAANADAVLPLLESLRTGLDELITDLRTDADAGAALQAGVEGVRRIPGKHGRRAVDYHEVVIEIPDAPGALARLFADVDAAGVNVEDIGIDHDPVRTVGHLSLSVEPERAEELRARMREAGWTLSQPRVPGALG